MLKERICDATFVGGTPQYIEAPSRHASRGVVFNGCGQIAMLYMKEFETFKLPGGSLEGEESIADAFVREVKEEIGCSLSWFNYIGYIEEHKNKTNFYQYSNCFVALKGNETYELNLTDHEKELGIQYHWMSPVEAMMKMKYYLVKSHDYKLKFMILRDLLILKFVLDHNLMSNHEA